MAEGWTRYLANERCTVKSAGIEAHGRNLRAIAVMKETDVDIFQCSGQSEPLKEGIRAAGGTPVEFGSIVVTDGIAMGMPLCVPGMMDPP